MVRLMPPWQPSAAGMNAVAECVQKQGLLLGVYGDSGRYTCQGFPGSFGHERQDAQTFAEWGEPSGGCPHRHSELAGMCSCGLCPLSFCRCL